MTVKFFRRLAFASCCGGLVALTGCTEAENDPYETQKPVIEDEGVDVDVDDDTIGEDIDEALDDAADTVTPDDRKVDIDTPLGDVDVDEDPATGRTKIDVDTDGDE